MSKNTFIKLSIISLILGYQNLSFTERVKVGDMLMVENYVRPIKVVPWGRDQLLVKTFDGFASEIIPKDFDTDIEKIKEIRDSNGARKFIYCIRNLNEYPGIYNSKCGKGYLYVLGSTSGKNYMHLWGDVVNNAPGNYTGTYIDHKRKWEMLLRNNPEELAKAIRIATEPEEIIQEPVESEVRVVPNIEPPSAQEGQGYHQDIVRQPSAVYEEGLPIAHAIAEPQPEEARIIPEGSSEGMGEARVPIDIPGRSNRQEQGNLPSIPSAREQESVLTRLGNRIKSIIRR